MTDETITPSWFIDEGIPGVGDRPSWLSDKFKNAAELAKSYAELERKFGTAPEEYDFSKSKYIDPDYVPFQELQALGKEKRVPKDVMDKMVDSFDKYMDEFKIDYSEEIKSLGDNAKERLKTLDNWAQANLSKESYESLTANLKSASAIKALEELRSKMMSSSTMVPGGNENANTNVATLEDVKQELVNNLDKYKADPKYRKDLQSRMEIASKTSTLNVIDKAGP
jgi:hypothetical protein